MSKAVPLVLPDSWSSLTQLKIFKYCSNIMLAAALPSSWNKLKNIQSIIITGEYGVTYLCRKPALLCKFLTCSKNM